MKPLAERMAKAREARSRTRERQKRTPTRSYAPYWDSLWYAGRDSNPQPSEPESDALSIEPPARTCESGIIIAETSLFVKSFFASPEKRWGRGKGNPAKGGGKAVPSRRLRQVPGKSSFGGGEGVGAAIVDWQTVHAYRGVCAVLGQGPPVTICFIPK